jgi:hypothetical protein
MSRSLCFLFCLLCICQRQLPAQDIGTAPAPGQYPEAEIVKTGIYLMNIYEMEINTHTFNADFYIWFKWKGDRDPSNIEFVNSVQKWGLTQTYFYEEPILLEDGYFYNGMRIESRFYHAFELGGFPLDRHTLSIQIENMDYPMDSLIYEPDSDAVFIRESLRLPGWDIMAPESGSRVNSYPTDFGEAGKRALSFSNFTFQLTLVRPVSYFFLKLLLPLFIAILIGLGALFISPQYTDARISVPIGSLLAVVFLQQSYSDALPDVGYMVLMDKIYLVVYVIVSSIMLRVMLVANRMTRDASSTELATIRKKDRRLGILLFAMLWLSIGGLILLK